MNLRLRCWSHKRDGSLFISENIETMKIKKEIIVEKAGEIVMRSGIESLTVSTIAQELDVAEDELSVFISKDNDIILLLFNDLENDLMDLLEEFAYKKHSPQLEIQRLFTRLYAFFHQKPYYLELVFDPSLMERADSIRESFLRIKRLAGAYLSRLINEGKNAKVFTAKQSTKSLVDGILSSFRFLMKDEQLMNEMIRKFGALKLQKD